MSNPVAVGVTKTDHNSVEILLLSSPPLSPAFNSSVGDKKQLQLRGGVGPRLWSVFSVSLLLLLMAQQPLRPILSQEGIQSLPDHLCPHSPHIQYAVKTLKADKTAHFHLGEQANLGGKKKKPRHLWRKRDVPMQGQINVRDFHFFSLGCPMETRSFVWHTTSDFLPGCLLVTGLHHNELQNASVYSCSCPWLG